VPLFKYTATYTPSGKKDIRPRTVMGTMPDTTAGELKNLLEIMNLTDIVVKEMDKEEEEDIIVEFDDEP